MAERTPTDPDRPPTQPRLRRLTTSQLTSTEVVAIRAIMDDAFGPDENERFTDDDWDHAVGGVHFVLDVDGEIVTHASVVERRLHVADRPYRTGYVEAVATAPAAQGVGYGSLVMTEATAWIRERFELGCLGTGRHRFYERLGWLTWRGPSSVRTPAGLRRTADDDGYLMVLPTRSSPSLDLTAPISCEWRPGDVW
jgi:aminoglycoside 2'-N-acetyltransferase I